ncbi:hypothetical protein CJ739_326 [Mariniflexile rhizosphaerae]|uniref:DUF3667 domain-containing protein n=1 Tax=unclassified Mariniflexile TaxID=2643887 RepID=UPI000CBC82FA|nr:DUF3667 domain-containing protein [Mariniflexile sp. TRM1-10]AXP79424.1 hypothetical protein CJ739_326 [Mariniflexile sp. TRM1-10]PLB19377.1 MAG: DUF3667 domain containing protein [Flavobacteriaceae bacterium FS1-H7996/R]
MGKEALRQDKTCLNCNYFVKERFCQNCGQENTETRKSFYHIFSHFFKDFTHYDNAFWRTIYNLLFKPAALSKAYMSGKRLYYLNPFRLYIFISFFTFFIISVFPNKAAEIKIATNEKSINQPYYPSIDSLHIEARGIDGLTKIGVISQKSNDTIKELLKETNEINSKGIINLGFKNINELDSLEKSGAKNIKVNSVKNYFLKKWLTVEEEHTEEEIFMAFSESFKHNFPKVLFIYMPIFAFILWLFNNKKKYYYFDHAIFTLHYFSFLLIMILVLFFIDKLKPLLSISPVLGWAHFSLKTVGILFMFYYFFPAHRLFYGDKFFLSFVKSASVYLINLFVFSAILVLFSLYTYLNLK